MSLVSDRASVTNSLHDERVRRRVQAIRLVHNLDRLTVCAYIGKSEVSHLLVKLLFVVAAVAQVAPGQRCVVHEAFFGINCHETGHAECDSASQNSEADPPISDDGEHCGCDVKRESAPSSAPSSVQVSIDHVLALVVEVPLYAHSSPFPDHDRPLAEHTSPVFSRPMTLPLLI